MTQQHRLVDRAGSAAMREPDGVDALGNPLLTRLALLGGPPRDDLDALGDLCRDRRQWRARATVVGQGRTAERVFVLLDGWACSYRLLADGRRQIIQLLLPGDICNLEALSLRQTGSAIGTLTACTMAAVVPQALRDLATARHPVRDALAWLGAVESANLVERNAGLGRRSAREHVAHLLCELLIRLTLVGRAKGNGYSLPLTQEEIADVLGLTSVHVNRVIQGLRRDGLIDYVAKELVIGQWSGLRAVAGFRADYLHLEGIDGTGTDFSVAPWAFGAGARPPLASV